MLVILFIIRNQDMVFKCFVQKSGKILPTATMKKNNFLSSHFFSSFLLTFSFWPISQPPLVAATQDPKQLTCTLARRFTRKNQFENPSTGSGDNAQKPLSKNKKKRLIFSFSKNMLKPTLCQKVDSFRVFFFHVPTVPKLLL